jgi:hypothetical protein
VIISVEAVPKPGELTGGDAVLAGHAETCGGPAVETAAASGFGHAPARIEGDAAAGAADASGLGHAAAGLEVGADAGAAAAGASGLGHAAAGIEGEAVACTTGASGLGHAPVRAVGVAGAAKVWLGSDTRAAGTAGEGAVVAADVRTGTENETRVTGEAAACGASAAASCGGRSVSASSSVASAPCPKSTMKPSWLAATATAAIGATLTRGS